MPTNDSTSRYRNVAIFLDNRPEEESGFAGELLYYGTRRAIKYTDQPDTVIHVVKEGDTLHKLANVYYQGFQSPSSLWWVIAEFQQTPIVDPTIKLEPGSLLHIPSPNVVGSLIGDASINRLQ